MLYSGKGFPFLLSTYPMFKTNRSKVLVSRAKVSHWQIGQLRFISDLDVCHCGALVMLARG